MNKNVIVIGGGIVGCLTALEFKKKGFEVTVVDKGLIGSEASSAAAGILYPLLPWNYNDEIFNICKSSEKFYEDLSKKFFDDLNIDIEFIKSQLLVFQPNDEKEIIKWADKNKIKIYKKNKSILIPNISHINPKMLMLSLKLYLKKIGINIIENSEILEFEGKNNNLETIVTKDKKKLMANYFILSAGAWTSLLNKNIAKEIRPIRGQIIQYEPSNINFKNILFSQGMYIFQRKDKSIIAGSTLDDVGFSKKNLNENLNKLDLKAKSIAPELSKLKIIKSWYGFRPGKDDNQPIISQDFKFKNIFIHSGHFRYGITMAPETSRRLMKLL